MAENEPLIPPEGGDVPVPPVFDPATADISALLSEGQNKLSSLAPLNQAVTDDQSALSAAQSKLQADQAASNAAVAGVQEAGHNLVAAISAQFFLTAPSTGS